MKFMEKKLWKGITELYDNDPGDAFETADSVIYTDPMAFDYYSINSITIYSQYDENVRKKLYPRIAELETSLRDMRLQAAEIKKTYAPDESKKRIKSINKEYRKVFKEHRKLERRLEKTRFRFLVCGLDNGKFAVIPDNITRRELEEAQGRYYIQISDEIKKLESNLENADEEHNADAVKTVLNAKLNECKAKLELLMQGNETLM